MCDSAHHDEALRKTRVIERKIAAQNRLKVSTTTVLLVYGQFGPFQSRSPVCNM